MNDCNNKDNRKIECKIKTLVQVGNNLEIFIIFIFGAKNIKL